MRRAHRFSDGAVVACELLEESGDIGWRSCAEAGELGKRKGCMRF